MRFIDPTGKDWRDFIRGIGEGTVQKVDNIVAAVSNPGKTLENALKPAESFGEAVFNAVDNASMGMVSTSINAGQAIYSDLNGGDGSATGQLIGGAIVDVTVAVATAKAGEAVGKGLSAASKGGNTLSESVHITKPSLAEQAKNLSNKVRKNSVEITTSNIKYHYDLKGASHRGVDTPPMYKDLFEIQILKQGKPFGIKIENGFDR